MWIPWRPWTISRYPGFTLHTPSKRYLFLFCYKRHFSLWQQRASAQGSANHSKSKPHIALRVLSYLLSCATLPLLPNSILIFIAQQVCWPKEDFYGSHPRTGPILHSTLSLSQSEYPSISQSDCTPRSHKGIAFPFVGISWTESPFFSSEPLLLQQEKLSPTDKCGSPVHTVAGSAGSFQWNGVTKARCFLPACPKSLEAPKLCVLQHSQRA